MTRRDLDAVLSSIDGALADEEFPDAMRWSPEPATVDASPPFDGDTVWQPPQQYEQTDEPRDRLGLPAFPAIDLVRPPEPELRAHGLVEVVFATTEEQRAAGRAVAARYEADRQRAHAARVRGRRHPVRAPRGPAPDLVLFDSAYLVDPAHRDEVRAREEEQRQRVVDMLASQGPLPPAALEQARRALAGRAVAAQVRAVPPDVYAVSRAAVLNAAEVEEAFARLREVFSATAAALAPLIESLTRAAAESGQTIAKFVEAWQAQIAAVNAGRSASGLPAPAVTLRDTDPRAYALQVRRTRGSGPNRQLQHEHRPRRLR